MKRSLLFTYIFLLSVFVAGQSTGDYRSIAIGDWEDNTIWEEYTGSGWVAATSAPSPNISFAVSVQHEVFYGDVTPANLLVGFPTAGSLTIESGAELILTTSGSSYNVIIYSGSTLTVEGTLSCEMTLTVNGSFVVGTAGDADMQDDITVGTGSILIESDGTGTGEMIASNSPTATVQRYIDSPTDANWHQIGIPVNNATAAAIYQDHSPDVWLQKWHFYETPIQTWQYITDETTALDERVGYMVTGDGSFTISWNGPIDNDGYTISIPGGLVNDNDHGILGNPFPCSYKVFNAGQDMPTNLYDGIWVWDPALSTPAYTFFQAGTGGTNPGVVSSGQSFFVQVESGSSATSFTCNPANRQFSDGNIFLKKGAVPGWEDDFGIGTYAMFKVMDGTTKDVGFVNFGEMGTRGFEDGYDGFKKFGFKNTPQLYFVEDELQLSIEYLKTLEEAEEQIVAMNFEPGISGEHVVAANLRSIPDTKVTLEDLFTGKLHIFNNAEEYTFTAIKGDNPERFLVHFLYSPTGIEDPYEENTNISTIYTYGKSVYITSDRVGLATVNIYDLTGREIHSENVMLDGLIRIPVMSDNNYLIVKVLQENTITTEKVFVK